MRAKAKYNMIQNKQIVYPINVKCYRNIYAESSYFRSKY